VKKHFGARTSLKKNGMPIFLSQTIHPSWKSLQKLYEDKNSRWDGWLFRGQLIRKGNSVSQPPLSTSLERGLTRFRIRLSQAKTWEYRLLRDFKRRYYLATKQSPDQSNDMEWLALLRHYGGPARLMDWTYSFWVAVHFAVDKAMAGDICEVWALETPWWREQAEEKYPLLKKAVTEYGSNSIKEYEQVFRMKQSPGLWFLNPFRLNDRLAAQQGSFVLPLDVTKPLVDNVATFTHGHEGNKHLERYRFVATQAFLQSCLRELHRMNINRMTLYPGIDGLAQHYENALGLPHLFKGIDGDLYSSAQ
jgi:hypothetical protein